MRRQDPLIIGAGPAGCAAAIALASAGARPFLLDRDETARDALCGGFLSWQTVEQLHELGVDVEKLGAHKVVQLRLFTGSRSATASLPRAAFGLSRHVLDTALRASAAKAGAELATDTIRKLEPGCAAGRSRHWRVDSIFLATGKEDVRGSSRPRGAADPALGLRIRLPASAERASLLHGAIELHLFKGGYAGIVMQEGGLANVCLALRKSALGRSGGDPASVLAHIAQDNPHFAKRLGSDYRELQTDTIGAVPYGFIAQDTAPGLFRLGDQAAVIPSLAGEGIGMGLASGILAARYWLERGPHGAQPYQQTFALSAHRPVTLARAAWQGAEHPLTARAMLAATRIVPGLAATIARLTRIEIGPSLARAKNAA